MNIERIDAWKTTDGQTFEFEMAAKMHQAELDLRCFVKSTSVGRGGEWDQGMFADWMLENVHTLARLLSTISQR